MGSGKRRSLAGRGSRSGRPAARCAERRRAGSARSGRCPASPWSAAVEGDSHRRSCGPALEALLAAAVLRHPRTVDPVTRYRRVRDATIYEELWASAARAARAARFELRRAFLLAEVRAGTPCWTWGAGDGQFTAELAARGAEVVGAEVAQAAVERARPAPSRSSASSWCRSTARCRSRTARSSLVWASEVIEHVADTGRWLSEVRRVLAPGGRLLLTTPSHGRLRPGARWHRAVLGAAGRSPAPLHPEVAALVARAVRV